MCLVPRAVPSVRRYGTTEREANRERRERVEKRKKGWLRRFRQEIKREETKRQLERELRGSVGRWSVDKKKKKEGPGRKKSLRHACTAPPLSFHRDDPPDGCESLRKRQLDFPK